MDHLACGACLALDPEPAATQWKRAGGTPEELSAFGYGADDLFLPEPCLDELRALGYR